uniref:Uncharacterized protein n=1 Tax=Cacopsylla melanoneura TaxID=428564 RepID=A0A8D8WIN2_9HEMI
MVCYYEQKDLQMVYNTQLIRSMSCVSSFTVFATSIGSGCRGWVSIAHCTVIITRVCCSISIIRAHVNLDLRLGSQMRQLQAIQLFIWRSLVLREMPWFQNYVKQGRTTKCITRLFMNKK